MFLGDHYTLLTSENRIKKYAVESLLFQFIIHKIPTN